MLSIKWKKYRTEYKSLDDKYQIKEGEIYVGLLDIADEEQNLKTVNENENITGIIDTVPFVKFQITKKENNFRLISISDISLRDYKSLFCRNEKWGEFETTEKCMNKAMSVIKGFQYYFGSGKENNGKYLRD